MPKHRASAGRVKGRPYHGCDWYTLNELREMIHGNFGVDAGLAAKCCKRFYFAGDENADERYPVYEMTILTQDIDFGTGHGPLTYFALGNGEELAATKAQAAARGVATRRNVKIWRDESRG